MLHQSDRGCQYASHDPPAAMKDFGKKSGQGNCYDNAVADSCIATLRKELLHLRRFATQEEARRAILEHIEVFYRLVRRHSKLGNVGPAEFERTQCAAQAAG